MTELTKKPTLSSTEWVVELAAEDGLTHSATFDNKKHAVAAWLDTQPSVLKKVTEEMWLTGEALANWNARDDSGV